MYVVPPFEAPKLRSVGWIYKINNILNDGFYNVHLCALPLPLLLLCDLKHCIRTVLPKAVQHPVLRPFASSSQCVQPCIVYLTFFPLLPLLFSRLSILGSIFLLVALSKTNHCALSLVWTVTVRKSGSPYALCCARTGAYSID